MKFPIKVKIYVFSHNDIDNIKDYDKSLYGVEFATKTDLIINQVSNGYSLLYTEDVFENINTKTLGINFINLLKNNLKSEVIEIELIYQPIDEFSQDCGIAILKLDDWFENCNTENIKYKTSSSIIFLKECWDEEEQEFSFDDIDDDEEDDEDMCIYNKGICTDCNKCKRSRRENEWFDGDDVDIFDEDDDEEDEYGDFDDYVPRYNRKSNKEYSRSKFIYSKNTKRNIRRHNIIITNDKSAINSEAKAIKEFLKDRYPGKQFREWRRELLDRYMTMTVMTKKMAKHMSNSHTSNIKKNKVHNGILGLTNKIFGYDLWNDSNR